MSKPILDIHIIKIRNQEKFLISEKFVDWWALPSPACHKGGSRSYEVLDEVLSVMDLLVRMELEEFMVFSLGCSRSRVGSWETLGVAIT